MMEALSSRQSTNNTPKHIRFSLNQFSHQSKKKAGQNKLYLKSISNKVTVDLDEGRRGEPRKLVMTDSKQRLNAFSSYYDEEIKRANTEDKKDENGQVDTTETSQNRQKLGGNIQLGQLHSNRSQSPDQQSTASKGKEYTISLNASSILPEVEEQANEEDLKSRHAKSRKAMRNSAQDSIRVRPMLP